MALVGFSAQQCVRRQWSTSWRVSGWDDLGDFQQSGALSITIDETDAQPGGCSQATIIADGNPFYVGGATPTGWVATPGTRNIVTAALVGGTVHATANGETIARALGLAGITGAGSVALGSIASSASGNVLSPRVGTASATLGAVASTATGVVGSAPVIGTASVTLGAVASTAAGTVVSPSTFSPVGTNLRALFVESQATESASAPWLYTLKEGVAYSKARFFSRTWTAAEKFIVRLERVSNGYAAVDCPVGSIPLSAGYKAAGLYVMKPDFAEVLISALPATAASGIWSQGAGWANLAAHAGTNLFAVNNNGTRLALYSSLDDGTSWVELALFTFAAAQAAGYGSGVGALTIGAGHTTPIRVYFGVA